MSEQNEPLVRLKPVDQFGIVVKDLDKAVQFYSSIFGWGPFKTMEFEMDIGYKGKDWSIRQRTAHGKTGDVEIELIQVLRGETPHTDFLATRGEGVHHLRFEVDNLAETLAALAKGGIEPVWMKSTQNVNFAYVNSDVVGGVMFELIEWKTNLRP